MELTAAVERFTQFIVQERDRYTDDDNNRVAISFAQVSRYLRFLEIIEGRYLSANEILVGAFKRRVWGNRELTADEIRDLDRGWQQALALHLEIESFLVFAKTLLDKIAHFIEDYFGKARGLSLRSHDQWCQNALAFAQAKGLDLPNDMVDTMLELRTSISDFRDKMIAHLQNPRVAHATVITAEGTSALGFGFIMPKASDRVSVEAIPVPQLVRLIDRYLTQLLDLVERNRSKTRYRLR